MNTYMLAGHRYFRLGLSLKLLCFGRDTFALENHYRLAVSHSIHKIWFVNIPSCILSWCTNNLEYHSLFLFQHRLLQCIEFLPRGFLLKIRYNIGNLKWWMFVYDNFSLELPLSQGSHGTFTSSNTPRFRRLALGQESFSGSPAFESHALTTKPQQLNYKSGGRNQFGGHLLSYKYLQLRYLCVRYLIFIQCRCSLPIHRVVLRLQVVNPGWQS